MSASAAITQIELTKTKTSGEYVTTYLPTTPLRFVTSVASIRTQTVPTFASPTHRIVKQTTHAWDLMGLFTSTTSVVEPAPTERRIVKPQCVVSEDMQQVQEAIELTLRSMNSRKQIRYITTIKGKDAETLTTGQSVGVSPFVWESKDSFTVGWQLKKMTPAKPTQ